MRNGVGAILAVAAFALVATGCSTRLPAGTEGAGIEGGPTAQPKAQAVLRSVKLDPALEDRILALDPDRITVDELSATLTKAPAPRIIMIHGGIYPVHLAMESAGEFLVGIGYPENRIRHPGDQRWSHSPYENSAQIAGLIAWYYEHDGMRPMMIGHSQGGLAAIKVLYDLAGRFDNPIRVWNPYLDDAENRTRIVDPLTGAVRPVIGLTLSYVSVVGAGGISLVLPNQWAIADKFRTIPDTVDDFTGYSIGLDLIAWTLPGIKGTSEFRHNGTALVRSIVLPASYSHLTVPAVQALADNKAARAWIEAYRPGATPPASPPGTEGYAILWAADVWHSVKKHWTLEAQRLIRARRAALGQP
jgi:hypothetical protein